MPPAPLGWYCILNNAIIVSGVYCINITDKSETILVEIGGEGKSVKYAVEGQDVKKDVSVNITSSDLAGVLKVIITHK